MNNSELIENAYAEAIKGINVEWLYGSSTKWYEYIIRLPDHLKFTYLIVLMDNQVFNGGLHQYFSNRFGQFAEETVKALVEIGATKKSELLKKAYQVVNANNVSPDQFRKLLLEMNMPSLFENDDLAAPLDELTDEYENRNEEDIAELLGSYLQNQ